MLPTVGATKLGAQSSDPNAPQHGLLGLRIWIFGLRFGLWVEESRGHGVVASL